MSYCTLPQWEQEKGDEFRAMIDNVNVSCSKGINSRNVAKTWKTFYIPMDIERASTLSVTDKQSYIDSCDIVSVDGKDYFKMTYKNIQKFATLEQSNAYHAFRKQHLCYVMSEAIKGTEFCYKMMGSNSPASDVDISVFSTALVPKNPSKDIQQILTTFNRINAERFGKEGMADVFDANVYFTNFLQVFEVQGDEELNMKFDNVREKLRQYGSNVSVSANMNMNVNMNAKASNVKSKVIAKMSDKKPGMDIGTISSGCFRLASNNQISARALYVQSINNSKQRVYATQRLAEYMGFSGSLLQDIMGLGIAARNVSNSGAFFQQLDVLFGECKKVASEIAKLISIGEAEYKRLMEDYFIQREYYIMDGLKDQAVANELVNTLSLATFLEDEAYHSQGAFLHINAQKDWGFELTEDDYIDSILENLGFMMEYSDGLKHKGMSPFARYEKINKYYSRISEALGKIEEGRVPCGQAPLVASNININTRSTEAQDKLRKDCSKDAGKLKAYNDMVGRMVGNFTEGIVSLEDVAMMNMEQLNSVTKSMMKRILDNMVKLGLQVYPFQQVGGLSKRRTKKMEVVTVPLNVASMVLPPLAGGKESRKRNIRKL